MNGEGRPTTGAPATTKTLTRVTASVPPAADIPHQARSRVDLLAAAHAADPDRFWLTYERAYTAGFRDGLVAGRDGS